MDQIRGSCRHALSTLDEDCLRAVLLWTRASDHPNLRLSCKRICCVLDSVVYRKERSDLGYAEVTVDKCNSSIYYDYSWGDILVCVDGWPLHRGLPNQTGRCRKIDLRLDFMFRKYPFYKLCGDNSDEARMIGSSLFANSGRPRVNCSCNFCRRIANGSLSYT